MAESIIIQTTGHSDGFLDTLEGRSFQLHRLPGGKLRLYEVSLVPAVYTQCPIFIAGERCGRRLGHGGKHMWGNGD